MDECRCEGGVNATGSGGHMEERWGDIPACVPTFQSSNWQNLDGPGAWGASQDLLYCCFKQLFLSHHCQTCSQVRAQKRRYPLLAARQWEVQIVELLNFTEGGLDIDRDLLSRALWKRCRDSVFWEESQREEQTVKDLEEEIIAKSRVDNRYLLIVMYFQCTAQSSWGFSSVIRRALCHLHNKWCEKVFNSKWQSYRTVSQQWTWQEGIAG